MVNNEKGHEGEQGLLGKVSLSLIIEQHCKKGAKTQVGITEATYFGYQSISCISNTQDLIHRRFQEVEPMAQLRAELAYDRETSRRVASVIEKVRIRTPILGGGIEQKRAKH